MEQINERIFKQISEQASEQIFTVKPANLSNPGVCVTEAGFMISTVFRGAASCGMVLYHVFDGRRITIPFTDAYRYGSLYCVRVSVSDPGSWDPKEWGYLLYNEDTSFIDPCTRSLITIRSGEDTIEAGGFFYKTDQKLPAFRKVGLRPGPEEFIYSLHIRGFTMTDKGIESVPGTFSAAAEKAAYLTSLGVTAVELMPVYELQPVTRSQTGPRTMEDALALYPVNHNGRPIRDLSVKKVNYWGYGRGFYYAPRASYSTPGYEGGPQKEFADMVEKFHNAGIPVYMQLDFPSSVTSQAQSQIARFYVTHYNIDGFRLMGAASDIRALTCDPLLSDIRLFHTAFDFDAIRAMDADNPEAGAVSTENLFNCSRLFSDLIRRFVKSDDYVMKEFLYEFLKVPAGHGNVHYICGSDGFTLRDLVSYNNKHNEMNGEGGNDGIRDNFSWNCGEEGDSEAEDVLQLRRSQIRNMLTLLFLSQGTLLMNAGDEAFNTQFGNNNPYCQDNETGWVLWDNGETGERIRDYIKKIIRFRKEHPVFCRTMPFKNTDYLSCGYPDLSLHGAEAWKPDLSHFSHSIGICLCENYVRGSEKTELVYVAVNMHWEKQELGLPKLAPGRRWNLVIDTAQEESFMDTECIPDDQHVIEVEPRSIRILCAVTSNKPIRNKKDTAKKAVIKETAIKKTEIINTEIKETAVKAVKEAVQKAVKEVKEAIETAEETVKATVMKETADGSKDADEAGAEEGTHEKA